MTEDREMKIMSLLNDDPSLILLLKSKYTTDSMWRMCIQKEPGLFQYMKNPTSEMCEFAVEEDGNNLKYILQNKDIELTSKMIWTAVKTYPAAIFLVPSNLRTDSLKEFAFDHDPSLMKAFSRIRQSYIQRKLKENPGFVRYLNHPTEDMWCNAIREDPNICSYIREYTPKMKDIIYEYYPSLVPLLPALNNESVGISEPNNIAVN